MHTHRTNDKDITADHLRMWTLLTKRFSSASTTKRYDHEGVRKVGESVAAFLKLLQAHVRGMAENKSKTECEIHLVDAFSERAPNNRVDLHLYLLLYNI
eukprot:COSAG03_NODE_328_length_8950_cov_24.961021_1_plen_99_part_00